MSENNQTSFNFTGKVKKQALIPLDIPKVVNSLSPAPYIPFWSLLQNQSLGFPYPEIQEGVYLRTGHQFSAEILTRFRLHPVFITARKAELAIRRNYLNSLSPDTLMKDVDPEHLPLINDLGLNGNTFVEELLSLAVVYRNTDAVLYLLNHWNISPDKGMDAAIGEQNSHMVHTLLKQGAITGTYLQQALVADNVNIDVIKVLLHHNADKSLKLKATGDNAISCARKAPKKHRKFLVSLISDEEFALSESDLQDLEEIQAPDDKYSVENIDSIGKSLTDSLNNPDEVTQLCHQLIREASTESLRYIVDAFLGYLKHCSEYDKSKQGRALRDGIFHLNFQVPENIDEFLRIMPHLQQQDKNELLFLFQRFNTEKSRSILKKYVPDVDHGVFARLRASENPFAERLRIVYPDVVVEIEVLETDAEGRLLRLMPTESYRIAMDEADALSKMTELLKDSDSLNSEMDDENLKYFLRSLIEERRIDLDSRVNGLWCIFSTDRLRGDDWHNLLHRPSIQAVAWLIWMYLERPEWISDVLQVSDDSVDRQEGRKRLKNIIDAALNKLSAWKLSSRRHGSIFRLEAMELLQIAGIERYMSKSGRSKFSRMWKSLIVDYNDRIEQGGEVLVDAYLPIVGDIGLRGDVDVMSRIEVLTSKLSH